MLLLIIINLLILFCTKVYIITEENIKTIVFTYILH